MTIQTGAKWIDVLQATFPSIVAGPYDSALGMGMFKTSTTATYEIQGVILGGGFGPLVNSHGLSVDRVVSIELVTANGEIICCDHIDEKDLFYAVRGGGGISFGIINRY